VPSRSTTDEITASELGFDPTRVELIGDPWLGPRRLVAIYETNGSNAAYVDVNPAATQILGYTREELPALRPGDLLHDRSEADPVLAELDEGRSVRVTVRLRHKSGYLVGTTIRVYRVFIGTRELNVNGEPIR
jgi:PAS domain S-box-containing protein